MQQNIQENINERNVEITAKDGTVPTMWIRKYCFRIRIRGSVILNYGSGHYRDLAILVTIEKICCQIGTYGSKSLNITKFRTFSPKFLFESLINRYRDRSKDPYSDPQHWLETTTGRCCFTGSAVP
jgi:hypothetical protein